MCMRQLSVMNVVIRLIYICSFHYVNVCVSGLVCRWPQIYYIL